MLNISASFSNFNKLVAYDFKNSFKYNRYKYLLFLVAVLAFVISDSGNTFGEHLVYSSRGMWKFIIEDNQRFEIPFNWLSLNLFIAVIIGNYTTNELYGFGQQLLLRSLKKQYWILSKYVYGLYTVVSVFILEYVVLFIVPLVSGHGISFLPNNEFALLHYGLNFKHISATVFFKVSIFQPIMASITISILQITLSWVIKPLISYLFVTIYVMASAYYQSYLRLFAISSG